MRGAVLASCWLAATAVAQAAPPPISWSADGARVVIADFWRFDPASQTFYEPDGRALRGGIVSKPGRPPPSAIASPSRAFSAWLSDDGRLCFAAARERERISCVLIPADPRPRRAARAEELRRLFAAPRDLYWIDEARRCQRWSLRIVDGTAVLQQRRGDATVEYTLVVGADRVSLRGPSESSHGQTRALGYVKDYDVGELRRDAVDVGGGRWFLDAPACRRAARSADAEKLVFTPAF